MSLRDYIRKRIFSKTPEPSAGHKRRSSKQLTFVVQEHHASHLHYDFRLEMDGVLKSWSVPKGPSIDPSIKRLAVAVEDHPYAYRTFEGDIPAGNYGAGHVTIWDEGTYEAYGDVDDDEQTLLDGLATGHINFVLHGKRLEGAFSLVRSPHMGETSWLLIKKHDDAPEPQQPAAQPIKAPIPHNLRPMLATLVREPFDDPGWLFEIKWDGYRAIGSLEGKHTQLHSRSGNDFSTAYPSVVEALSALPHDAVIDGEVVALDSHGKAHFGWLQNYRRDNQGHLAYVAFDLLWLDGYDLRGLPLTDRKELLRKLIPPKHAILKYSDHVLAKGKHFFGAAERQQLEGIMAKRAGSTYATNRRSEDWLKIKTQLRQEVVIGGFTEPRGSRQHIGALIVGYYQDDQLVYAGHASGIPPSQLAPLRKKLQALERKTSPFAGKVTPNAPVHWVQPKLICEITFSEWTADKRMRQPIFVGMRNDKLPTEVTIEKPRTVQRHRHFATDAPASHTAENSRIALTHADKVFWPEQGITKGDLLAYYESVADTILPYLNDRPLSLLRHPDGYKGPSFFQKDITKPPTGIPTKAIYSKSNHDYVHYLIGGSRDVLRYMVQLGCIEINPWNSTRSTPDKPDWIVIDLDPEGVRFETVIKVAQAVKAVCDDYEIPAYPKTSGKTGIHIYIPLGAKYDYDQAQQFAHLIATLVHQRIPEHTSLERKPSNRQHKVYLDYLQNRRGQTIAAPYSVRPAKAASVSAPLYWSEVKPGLKPEHFTIHTMPERIKKIGDIWQPVLGKGVDMRAIIKRMETR